MTLKLPDGTILSDSVWPPNTDRFTWQPDDLEEVGDAEGLDGGGATGRTRRTGKPATAKKGRGAKPGNTVAPSDE